MSVFLQKELLHVVVYIILAWASNIVCSAVSGNAKASISGTDDRRIPRLNQYVFCKYL